MKRSKGKKKYVNFPKVELPKFEDVPISETCCWRCLTRAACINQCNDHTSSCDRENCAPCQHFVKNKKQLEEAIANASTSGKISI